jgi:hypothetical protein
VVLIVPQTSKLVRGDSFRWHASHSVFAMTFRSILIAYWCFTLLPGESTRQSFAGIDDGPVQIVSDVPIVVAEWLIYKVNGVNTSFSEMMALPNTQLDTIYWLPWYNNVDLDTQLRFAVP